MSGGFLLPGFADTLGLNPVVPDNLKAIWGTDSDVRQLFDGTKLVFEDSFNADVLTFNAATRAVDLVWPAATDTAHFPVLSLYRDEDGDDWAETDLHGAINFDANVGDNTRETFFSIRGTGGFAISAAATIERGTGGVFVLQDGALFKQVAFEGAITLGGVPGRVIFNSNLFFNTGTALQVATNEAAFKHSTSSGGLFFLAGTGTVADGFQFRDGSGATIMHIPAVGGSTGGVLVQPGTATTVYGIDTISAGQLNLARNTATNVKCWSDFEIDDAENVTLGTGTGTEFPDTASQKLGFWGVTPIIQPANTVAIDTLLTSTGLRASGGLANFDTDVKLPTVGTGLYVKEGTNATMGTQALVAGVAVVATTKVTANSRIFAFANALGGTSGLVRVTARTAGTSFTLTSTNVLDTSTYAWIIIEPA